MQKKLLFKQGFTCHNCPMMREHDQALTPMCDIDEKEIKEVFNPPEWCKLREGKLELQEYDGIMYVYLNPKP